MRTIKEGDKVTIHWTDSEINRGVVRHTPDNTGDMWYIDCECFTMAVNPQSNTLESIVKGVEKP